MKARKSVARNRWARSIPLQWDTNQYTLDLEKGYRPVGQKNTSTGPVIGQQEEEEGFSGMGEATTSPSAGNSLSPSTALKVTYRYRTSSRLHYKHMKTGAHFHQAMYRNRLRIY